MLICFPNVPCPAVSKSANASLKFSTIGAEKDWNRIAEDVKRKRKVIWCQFVALNILRTGHGGNMGLMDKHVALQPRRSYSARIWEIIMKTFKNMRGGAQLHICSCLTTQ